MNLFNRGPSRIERLEEELVKVRARLSRLDNLSDEHRRRFVEDIVALRYRVGEEERNARELREHFGMLCGHLNVYFTNTPARTELHAVSPPAKEPAP